MYIFVFISFKVGLKRVLKTLLKPADTLRVLLEHSNTVYYNVDTVWTSEPLRK